MIYPSLTVVLGEVISVTATFENAAAEPVDPDTVTLRARPSKTQAETVLPATKIEAGRYTASFAPDTPGAWHLRVEGDGVHQAAAERMIKVERSHLS